MSNVYLGRQPILDSNGSLNSYEILYRDGHAENSSIKNMTVRK